MSFEDLHAASTARAQPATGKFHTAGHENVIQNCSAIYFKHSPEGYELDAYLGWVTASVVRHNK